MVSYPSSVKIQVSIEFNVLPFHHKDINTTITFRGYLSRLDIHSPAQVLWAKVDTFSYL